MFTQSIDVRTGDSHSIIDAVMEKRTNYTRNVTLEDYIWVAERVIILKGVTIGKSSIISSCSIVTGNVLPVSFAAGFPAKVIRTGVAWKREKLQLINE
jgi:acetyltransferase-like isoleucine patch superfamily enzyme